MAKTRTPLSPYQVTLFTIEICKLRGVTSDDDIRQAAQLALVVLQEIENHLQNRRSDDDKT